MLQAVIMAGGVGSRLRPLTCDLPKPMARLCGRPNIEYILDLLKEHGVTHAAVTTQYLPQVMENHFEDGEYNGVAITFVQEPQPLGTAGSVKNAAAAFESAFIVISGDAMCDFDLTAALACHRQRAAAVTIVVKAVEDPREYGLVDTDENGDVAAFVEKPCYSQAVSSLANTGVYIISPSVLKLVPSQAQVDFAGDLFPLLLQKGQRIATWEDKGYWCDIGDIEAYRTCQQDMLLGRVSCRIVGQRDTEGNVFCGMVPHGSYTLVPPVYIGADVNIGDGAVIDGLSVVDDGVQICAGAHICGGVMLQNSYAGPGSTLTGALLCAGASVQRQAMLFENAVLGAGAVAGAHSVLRQGVRVWAGKQVEEGAILRDNLKYGTAKPFCFEDDGMCGVEFTPELAVRLGLAVGSAAKNGRIGVGSTGDRPARVLRQALLAGVLATGVDVLDFGPCFEALFRFALSFCGLSLGIFIQGGEPAGVRVYTTGGLPATRAQERTIEGMLLRGEYNRCPAEEFGEVNNLAGMRVLYETELLKYAPKGLGAMAAVVRSANCELSALLQSTLFKLGAEKNEELVFKISPAGDSVSMQLAGVGYLPHSKLLAIACVMEFRRGHAVALPFDAPRMLDELAQRWGGSVQRYLSCPADSSDSAARELACAQPWSRDALFLTVKLLYEMQQQKIAPYQLFRILPSYESATLVVPTGRNPAQVIKALSVGQEQGKAIGEGVVLRSLRGVVLIKPLKKGGGVRLTAEAQSMEAAMELCEGYEKMIQPLLNPNAEGREPQQ